MKKVRIISYGLLTGLMLSCAVPAVQAGKSVQTAESVKAKKAARRHIVKRIAIRLSVALVLGVGFVVIEEVWRQTQ